MTGLPLRRLAALIAVPVVVIACAVFATATIERDSALHAYQQQAAGQRLLVAMLDEETGSRGYFETRQARFLAPWYRGQADFAAALSTSRRLAAGDAPLQDALSDQARQNAQWLTTASGDVQLMQLTGRRPTVSDEVGQKAMVDNFRELNQLFAVQLASRRDRSLSLATWLAVGDAAALSILLVVIGLLIVRRTGQRESMRLRRQQELRELLQVSASEEESQGLLIRHVERVVPGAGAAVFNRNNSEDRLEAALSEKAELTPLRDLEVVGLRPRSCLAVRLSRAYERQPGEDSLMRCEACGKIAGAVLCEPLLVGGQVIGSVLVARERSIDPAERDRIHDSVSQAAPILANQRNLALAERRAASDALTGLPNRRAADEAIKRMVAHAGRTVTPIAAVLLDLDHFKQVNDLHGHEHGDKALATIGQILSQPAGQRLRRPLRRRGVPDAAARHRPHGRRGGGREAAAYDRPDRGSRRRSPDRQLRDRGPARRRRRTRAADPQGRPRALRRQGRGPQPGRSRRFDQRTQFRRRMAARFRSN